MSHLGIYDRALNLSLDMFCTDMVSSCKNWYEQNKNDGNVIKNLELGLNFYPSGTYPFLHVGGVDIIG